MFLLWFDGFGEVFCLFTVNILNLTRPCLIKLAKIWKPLLLLQDCALDKDGVVSTYYKI